MGNQGASFNPKKSPLIEGQVTLSSLSKSSSNWRESSPLRR